MREKINDEYQYEISQAGVSRDVPLYRADASEFYLPHRIAINIRDYFGMRFGGVYRTEEDEILVLDDMPAVLERHVVQHELNHAKDAEGQSYNTLLWKHKKGIPLSFLGTLFFGMSAVFAPQYFYLPALMCFGLYATLILDMWVRMEQTADDGLEPPLEKILHDVYDVEYDKQRWVALLTVPLNLGSRIFWYTPKNILLGIGAELYDMMKSG